MKHFKIVLFFALFNALLMGCTMQMQPVPMNTQIGSIGISESKKIPLNVAVVVPDPPTHRLMFKAIDKAPVDRTDQLPGENFWPLNIELAKASKDVFSQIFKSVTLLRKTPALGSNYDLIIIARLKEVQQSAKQPKPFQVDMPYELDYLWNLTVMNNEGVEILKREGRTEPRIFMATTSMDVFVANIGRTSSELMSEMVTSWGRMIYKAKEIRAYLREMEETED